MRIDSLKTSPDRAGRYWIHFDNGTSMGLYRQTVEDFGLYAGMELTEAELEKLRVAAGKMSAKMRAVRIVSASGVSKKDLEQRLVRKGEDPEHARAAVEWMAELNLVDDRQTARQIVDRCVAKGYGPARVKQMLYEKRIPKEYWDEALENYPNQSAYITAYLQAHLADAPTEKETKRVVDALLRRGHSWSSIRQALKRIVQDADDFLEE